MTDVSMRPAGREDSRTIAELFLISSDGLAEYIWSQLAEPGETPLDAGARRYARDGVAFSYQNCILTEIDGVVVGMAHSFPMDRIRRPNRKRIPCCGPTRNSRTTAASISPASPSSPSIGVTGSAPS